MHKYEVNCRKYGGFPEPVLEILLSVCPFAHAQLDFTHPHVQPVTLERASNSDAGRRKARVPIFHQVSPSSSTS